MNTLLLDQVLWDLCKDANGNIAMATEPYAIAQDVASAVRVFLGEVWYDTTQGIPYSKNVLGQRPQLGYLKAQIERVALTVPGVVKAQCLFASFSGRVVRGQIKIIDTTGASNNVQF
ncbi:MAG: hypothetical protein JWP38_3751 [Herbaspirillum sp.]|nr:hypothetical protein [Herbaspirillum sp.]